MSDNKPGAGSASQGGQLPKTPPPVAPDTTVFLLPTHLGSALELEAARRNVQVDSLVHEMWELYKTTHQI